MHKTRMKTLATAMLAASLLTGASATECTWTGEGEDNSWSNPANWGGNGYPGNETDVANFGEGNWTTAGVYAITFDLTDKEATQWTDDTTAPQFPRWRLKGLRTQNAHFAMRETHDFGIVRFTR